MNDGRWERMVALFERALEQPDEVRNRFVHEQAADPELRDQVLAMLSADAAPQPLLDGTAADGGAGAAEGAAGLTGRQVGPYTVIRGIGRGAMATVCLAFDPKHRREVALKLLDPGVSAALGSERFRREIEVVAGLQHPHIVPLYDSGEADGRRYYVMPLVQGETLRERIARVGPLPIAEVRRITAEVGAALDYAHRQGVIHRDVKPANILLDDEHAAIADFGIARRVVAEAPDEITATGVVVGTPAYMSPEQVLGEQEPDARSDVYGLACVVFAMLTGKPPFRAATATALLAKQLHAPVPSVRDARPELAPEVDAVLARALAKDPAARYPTIRELMEALAAALAIGPGVGRRIRWRLVAVLAAALVVGVVVLWVAKRETPPPSIAVLPFVNLSGDSQGDYLSDGMTDELIGALAQIGRLRVIPRTTAFAYKGWTGDFRILGRTLDVSRILEGSVRQEGDRLLVRTGLYDAVTGDRLWTDRYERSSRSMMALQGEIAGAIAEQLLLTLLPGERARLAARDTEDPDAYDSYLRGRHFFNIRTNPAVRQAVGYFQRALAIDSMYARAYAGLADSYSILAWTGGEDPTGLFALAEQAARRALALDSLLAEAHLSLSIVQTFHHWDWVAANRSTARALALDSTAAEAWYWRTWHLVAEGRMNEALGAIGRAQRLEQLSLINNARLATVLAWMDRLAESDSVLQRTIEIEPTYPVALVQRARLLSLLGRHEEALAALPPDSVHLGSFEAGIPGFVRARAGRRDEALAAARALEARQSPPGEGIAAVYVGLGDTASALDWLERAVEDRGTSVVFLAAEPMYAPLRGHPRFRRVLEQIGLGAAR